MGLLNHLFRDKKDIAKKLTMKDDKRWELWQQHISNWKQRESLCKHFSSRNIAEALQNFKATNTVLNQIELLISPELITIGDEEKLEKEILHDFKSLKSVKEIESISIIFLTEKRKQKALLGLFHEIHNVLKTELHLINLIRQWPSNVKKLLGHLFELIFHREDELYKPFRSELFRESEHEAISKFVKAVLFQKELKDEIETDKDKFAKEIFEKMGQEDSKHHYRQLGEEIFSELAEMAGAPLSKSEDITDSIRQMEDLMEKDDVLYQIIKKLRRSYNNAKIWAVILAFRKAFDKGSFEELTGEFAT